MTLTEQSVEIRKELYETREQVDRRVAGIEEGFEEMKREVEEIRKRVEIRVMGGVHP